MNANILLVGDDLSLLTTRAMVLAQWRTEIASSSESLQILSVKPFDVVIIGQLVPAETAKQLIERSKSLDPMPSLLAIRFPGDELNGIASYSTAAAISPGWLRDCVSRLLANRLSQD
jgi:DNA-binding NtrC family response regulator